MGLTPDLAVQIGPLLMPNPVGVASGTFGYGEEYEKLIELDRLGTFAETFAGETIADSDDAAVADAMASHILGPGPQLPGHPQLLWAGTVTDGAVAGFTWSWQLGTWTRRPTRCGSTRSRRR